MLISIITVVKNDKKNILKTINSVKNQNFKNFEHIIIDGKSNDNTLQKIQQHKFNPKLIISKKDNGIYDALNTGIKLSTGDIVGILHSDDFFSDDNTLEKIAEIFNADSSIDLVYGDLNYVSRFNSNKIIRRWISKDFSYKDLKYGWMPPHPTMFIKRKLISSLNGFDSNFKISGDYMMILKILSLKNIKTVYIPRTLIHMRIGGLSNKSLKKILIKIIEDWSALRKNKFNYFFALRALFFKNFSKISQFFI